MKYFFKNLFIALSLLAISACSDNSATVRFKAITVLEVDGELKEFYSVLQTRIKLNEKGKSATGFAAQTRVWSEATVIDLGEKGRAYVLHTSYRPEKKRPFSSIYPEALFESYGLESTIGKFKQDDISALKNISGKEIYSYGDRTPTLVFFENEADQNSIKYLNQNSISDVFDAGVVFKKFYLEIIEDEITDGKILEYLPWLKLENYKKFKRAPRGTSSKSKKFVGSMNRTIFVINEQLKQIK